METFWNTIAQYNESTWWAQILITAAGILLTALLYRRPTVWTKRSMKIYMVFLNGWIALVYYAMYCDTRNYHYVLSAFWGTVALIWLWEEIKRHRRLFLNLIFINMLMGYTAFYFGVDFVSGAISSIIMGMTPLINVLLAHLLASNDKLNGYKIVSLIVSLAGLLLIVGTGSDGEPLDWKGITGIVLLLLSIIFQGYSAISVSEEKDKVNPIFLNAVQMFFGGALIYIIGLSTEGYHSFIGKPAGFYISLGILVFISVFAFSFWFMALQSKGAKVSDINMCRLINPILGAVLSWIMLAGEYPTFSTVAGMLIIVSSLVIYFKGAEIAKYFSTRKR